MFRKLSTTNAALQVTHHSEPFSIEVMEAPNPKEVNWKNVGRTHKDLQIGLLGSLICTTALCLLWTLPMWTKFMDLLANSLPSQGTYFMQILLVSTSTTAGMELLRVVPLISAFLRQFIGPNLTEKERSKSFMFLRPISDPKEFEHAEFAAQLVLYFMVLFVYAVISPITTPIITAFCFAFMGAMFRTQFMYCYPKTPDSGGKLWANFIQILLTCMIIAEIILLGLLALKKGVVQFPLFLPLMYITVLFNLYIKQKHFTIAAYLPTRECVKADLKRPEPCDYSFVLGAYTQPELKAKEPLRPDPDLLDYDDERGLLPDTGEEGMGEEEEDNNDEVKGSSSSSRNRVRLTRGLSTRRVVLVPDDNEF